MKEGQQGGKPEAGGDAHYIVARGLGLSTLRMRCYEDVDLDIARGSVHALCAEHRSGKTELLLTLAGRMRAHTGTLTVDQRRIDGLRDVDWLRRRCGLGFFDRLNDVSPALRVRTVTSAELNLAGRPSRRDDVDRYLDEWGLADVAECNVGNLPSRTHGLLGIALGMCAEPRTLVIHDIERDLTKQQGLELLHVLRALAKEHGTTVVCGVTDYDLAVRFDGVTCISDDARAQQDAYLRGHVSVRAA